MSSIKQITYTTAVGREKISGPQKKMLARLLPVYELSMDALPSKWWLEIGFGDGAHLHHLALENPNEYYVGVEMHPPSVARLLKRLDEKPCNNLKIYPKNIFDLLPILPEQCVSGVYILFPDPWRKRRHHKRRLIQPPFMQSLKMLLVPGGVCHLATDWEHYAWQMLAVLENLPGLSNQQGVYQFAPPSRVIETKFEAKGLAAQRGIYHLSFIREENTRLHRCKNANPEG